jgi:hypothetical protein
VPIIAGGAGARILGAELAAMDVVVEGSIPGLVAELRRIGAGAGAGAGAVSSRA